MALGASVNVDAQVGVTAAGFNGYRDESAVIRGCAGQGSTNCAGGTMNQDYAAVEVQHGRGGNVPVPFQVQGGASETWVRCLFFC